MNELFNAIKKAATTNPITSGVGGATTGASTFGLGNQQHEDDIRVNLNLQQLTPKIAAVYNDIFDCSANVDAEARTMIKEFDVKRGDKDFMKLERINTKVHEVEDDILPQCAQQMQDLSEITAILSECVNFLQVDREFGARRREFAARRRERTIEHIKVIEKEKAQFAEEIQRQMEKTEQLFVADVKRLTQQYSL